MMDPIIKQSEEKMKECIKGLHHELGRLRTGRAHAAMLDHVHVDYYGTPTPIRALANVSVQDGRSLVIKPYDKGSVKPLEQAIAQHSGLNLPVNNEGGHTLRMTFPELTTETRKNLVKEMKKKGEEAKVRVRGVRRDSNEAVKNLEKAKKVTEDESKKGQESIQKLTDKFCAEIDQVMEAKEKDIMTV